MSSAHIHLILNHFPIVGVMVAVAIFSIGRLRRNALFQQLSLWLLVVFALAAIPLYLTGESAEHTVSRLPDVSKALIENHEKAAGVALVVIEVLGGLGLLGLLLFGRTTPLPKAFAVGVLVVALSATGLFAWTGYLGGQIRHSEIRRGGPVPGPSHGEHRRGSSYDRD